MTAPPSAAQQLAFLTRIQRLFAEGDFTATYKFALVIALCDLSVERCRDDGAALRLSYVDIAEKFIELYWSHTIPYARTDSGAVPMTLIQNHGSQAAVLVAITRFKQTSQIKNVSLAPRHSAYPELLLQVASIVSSKPAQYLQNLGGTTDPFLYERFRGGVELKLGVSYCLRQFQGLIQQLARQRWVQHIKANRLNAPALGSEDDLGEFLFATSRQSLEIVRNGLKKLVNSECFYCGSTVSHAAEVDHFIPFSSYPRDLIHNFVYAHPKCNRNKSDTLAAFRHLDGWLKFAERERDSLLEIGEAAGIPGDLRATFSVAEWSYQSASDVGARAWIMGREYETVGAHYLSVLSASD